jgi:hypothetical protein
MPRSSPATNFEDGIGEALRRFLGKVVSDTTLDGPVRVAPRELRGIRTLHGSSAKRPVMLGIAREHEPPASVLQRILLSLGSSHE